MSAETDGEPGPELHLQDTFRLSAQGVAKALGDLEARVMTVVWALGRPAPARVVFQEVAVNHPVAIHTVITVLNKLVRKGLLTREKRGDVLHYAPRVTEAEFRREVSRRAMEGILSLGPEAVTSSFVDVLARHDPAHLEALSRLVRERMEREEGR